MIGKKFLIILLILVISTSIFSCKSSNKEVPKFIQSKTLDFEEFKDELLKIDNLTINFENNLSGLNNNDYEFKIIRVPFLTKDNPIDLYFYCLMGENKEISQLIYTNLDLQKDRLFHGSIYQCLDEEGHLSFNVNGGLYRSFEKRGLSKVRLTSLVNVVNKENKDDYIKKEPVVIKEPGLDLDINLIHNKNDFSLLPGDLSTIYYHILGKPHHLVDINFKNKIILN